MKMLFPDFRSGGTGVPKAAGRTSVPKVAEIQSTLRISKIYIKKPKDFSISEAFSRRHLNLIILISMTFHDHFCSQDSRNFSQEICNRTILETIISVTKFSTKIRVKFVIFHDHFHGCELANFSQEICYSTILETIVSVIIF